MEGPSERTRYPTTSERHMVPKQEVSGGRKQPPSAIVCDDNFQASRTTCQGRKDKDDRHSLTCCRMKKTTKAKPRQEVRPYERKEAHDRVDDIRLHLLGRTHNFCSRRKLASLYSKRTLNRWSCRGSKIAPRACRYRSFMMIRYVHNEGTVTPR